MSIKASLIKLLVFGVATLVATAILILTIGNITFEKDLQYNAVFSDVTGLQPATDVRIAGVKVGQVKSIKLVNEKQALVKFTVRKGIEIPQSSRVEIRYLNLVGGRFLTVLEGAGSTMMRENGTVPVAQTKPALDLTVLLNGFKPLFQALNPADVNRLAYEIIETLQGEGGTVNELLINTASLTNTIANKDALIGDVISNLNVVLATVDARDGELDQLIVQMQRLFSGLAQDRVAIGNSLTGIDTLTTSVATLVTDIRPSLRPDIQRLGSVAQQLASDKKGLQTQIRNLPNRLNTVTRTATYGSYFNFYLCKADGQVTLGDQVIAPISANTGGVCTDG